jgi:hypothetical protein
LKLACQAWSLIRAEERLTADVPAVALDFLDEHPDHLAEGLRSLEGDHYVSESGGHVMLLLFGEGSRGEFDIDQRHACSSAGGWSPWPGCGRAAHASTLRLGDAGSRL